MLMNEMMTFYYVVQLKSFSQTAIKLNVSKSHISKNITRLEKDLKVALLNRSTRQLSLTEEGATFYQHCQTLFEQAQMSYDAIANLRKQPTGTLKISVPPALALHLLKYPLAKFSQENPEVKLNIVLESRIADIIEQGYDLALRSAVLPDSNLIAQQIYTCQNLLCASPAYLKKYGEIQTPQQLLNHRIALYNNGKSTHELKFMHNKKSSPITLEPYLLSNSGDFILRMTQLDCCMAILPEFMAKSALQDKTLIHCMPDYALADSTLYVIYPDKKFIPLRVRIFIEQLKKYLETV